MTIHKRFYRYIPLIGGFLVVAAVTSGLGVFISNMLEEAPNKKKMIQQISLIKPPPPPPPKIEKPPEPPKVEEVKVEEQKQPEEMPDTPTDEPPAGDLLGLDADGAGGGDAFGLLAKKGGRSLLGSGGNEFGWYTNRLSSYIEETLYNLSEQKKYKKLRDARYSVKVKVWIDDDLSLRGTLVAVPSPIGKFRAV